LGGLQRIQYQRFIEIVRRKEALVMEMYLSDRDLSIEAKRYSQILNDIALEV
jgi:hypothetical protein